uniref:Nonstructural protein n=1 Tax=Dulem virus 173 TaxID=3145650 RepID=A0AAU8B677_9VIRU
MKYGVYSIYDSAAGVFTAPTIDISDASAVRAFQQALENSASVMSFKPEDFSLHQIGVFDVESGLLEPVVPSRRLFVGGSGQVEKE